VFNLSFYIPIILILYSKIAINFFIGGLSMKLQTVKRPDGALRYVLTLPKAIVEAKKWKQGTGLKIQFNEKGNIELKECSSSPSA